MELESILLPGIEPERPIVIAGPCSAETEEQVMETARQLASKGIKIFRAGIWKPRTKPGGFEGIGVEGLAWLKEVKRETGMYVATEVATAKHVYEALKHGIDRRPARCMSSNVIWGCTLISFLVLFYMFMMRFLYPELKTMTA